MLITPYYFLLSYYEKDYAAIVNLLHNDYYKVIYI